MDLASAVDLAVDLISRGLPRARVLALFSSEEGSKPPPAARPPSHRPRRRGWADRGSVPAAVLRHLPGDLDALVTATGCRRDSIRAALRRLEKAGKVELVDGVYRKPGVTSSNPRPTAASRKKRGKVNPFDGRKPEEPSPEAPTPDA